MKNLIFFPLFLMIMSCSTIEQKSTTNIETGPIKELDNPKIVELDPIWERSDFDSIVAVILNGNSIIGRNLLHMDTMFSDISRRKLNSGANHTVVSQISRSTINYSPSDCFLPFHGLFFYNGDKIVGRMAICFSCNRYYALPKHNSGLDFNEIKVIFKEAGLPTYNWDNPEEVDTIKFKYKDYFKK